MGGQDVSGSRYTCPLDGELKGRYIQLSQTLPQQQVNTYSCQILVLWPETQKQLFESLQINCAKMRRAPTRLLGLQRGHKYADLLGWK